MKNAENAQLPPNLGMGTALLLGGCMGLAGWDRLGRARGGSDTESWRGPIVVLSSVGSYVCPGMTSVSWERSASLALQQVPDDLLKQTQGLRELFMATSSSVKTLK